MIIIKNKNVHRYEVKKVTSLRHPVEFKYSFVVRIFKYEHISHLNLLNP